MGQDNLVIFDPFCLDLGNECLWRGSEAIKLRPKVFAVLHYLLDHPGQLVTKEQLLNAVWPETFVTDAVLKVTIRLLRSALEDDPNAPRFIQTAHRRGYRFIANVARGTHIPQQAQTTSEGKDDSILPLRDGSRSLQVVGRDNALSLLERYLEKMRRGQRQLVFVTGEAGIGKTTLVDSFARSISPESNVRIGRGQCLEQYGTSEAYLPIFDAIGRLCRDHPEVIDVLRTHAPMWLLQMSSLVSAAEREALGREVAGASRERMLREIGNALEALTESVPLLLILEDLQWSDHSTLDLISFLAKQRQAAHLLVIGTYRTAELIASGHPLNAIKQDLLAQQQCGELPLGYLSEATVMEYLGIRFPAHRFPSGLASLIHKRTEGNPLFMVQAVNHLITEGLIAESEGCWQLGVNVEEVEVGVPDSIKQMIENQLDHLDTEQQRILKAASVAGTEFSAEAVAAGLGQDRATVERGCSELVRRQQFLKDRGVQILPNGEAVGRYGFIHSLYQNMLYERVPASTRVQMHRRLAEVEEELYGERSSEIAAPLAMHFERGRDNKRAAKYLEQAARNAIRRFAYREAVNLARRGLELLSELPDSAEQAKQELDLQLTLGVPLIATEGYAAPNVGGAYLKARELCQQLGYLTPEISEVLWGLRTYHTLRGEFATAHEIAEEFLSAAARLADPELAMRGHWALETIFLHQGKFTLALEQYDRALALYDPQRHRDDAFTYAQNPGVGSAYTRARELCRQLGRTPEIFPVLWGLFVFHLLRADMATARETAEEFLRLAEQESNAGLLARGHVAVETTLMHLGEFGPAFEHFEKGVSFYNREQDRDDWFKYTQNPAVGMRCHGAWTLWFLGKPDRALAPMKQALTVARELSEPHGVAHTFYFAAVLHHFRREPRLTQEFAAASLDVSSEHGLVLYQASAKVLLGWALVEQTLHEEGIALMREGLAAHQATGTEMARPHFLILLGEALGKARQPEEGLDVLEEALALIHRKGEKCYLAEVYRVKGELISMQAEKVVAHSEPPAVSEAEACFHQSLEIAQQQKAKSYELRTSLSLARLYQKQNKREAARDLLAPIFSSFTEGFDTGDLSDAKALLADLS